MSRKAQSLADRLQWLKDHLKKTRSELTRKVCDEGGLDVVPSFLEFSHWDCEDSPAGICVYDGDMDPAHDHCLFCGQPHERK